MFDDRIVHVRKRFDRPESLEIVVGIGADKFKMCRRIFVQGSLEK